MIINIPRKTLAPLLTSLLLFACVAVQALTPVEEAEISVKVERLLSKMTLEEKVAQMRIFHANKGINAAENNDLVLSDDVQKRLKHGIAGIKNPGEFLTPERAALHNNKLQKYIVENSRLGIPALFVTEAYNGVDATGTTRFSRPMNMAATWNTELVEQVWDTIGREARLRGLHMCHSPEADIMRDPRFGRMSEAYSEDTHLTTEMVVAAIDGVQGNPVKGMSQGTHIGAVTKHFAGYGQVEGGLNFASVQVSPRTFIDEILPPFKAAVQRADTLGIMASHGDINGVASHGSYELMTEILRKQWGFKGYAVSDSNDIARLFFFMGVAENADEAALMGLKAGMDIDLYSDVAYSQLPRLATEDPSIMPHINRAVRHVLRAKYILGLFDNPYIDVSTVAKSVRNTESLALARKADTESIILLKNNDVLPMSLAFLKGKKVGLIGPVMREGAAEKFKQVWGNDVELIVEQGFELTDRDQYEPRVLTQSETQTGFDNALAAAKKSDVVVLFLGGDEFTAKEAYFAKGLGDRASIDPVGMQDALIKQVKALGKPVIVVLKHRRTLSINAISQHADAILDAWELSEHGDIALADMIIGNTNPSGKLPVTVPRSIGQIPFHYSRKNINLKKRYMFTEEGPLYPFGFGLSYTEFGYSKLKVSKKRIAKDESLTVSVRVKNTGDVEGKEVVQLYIQDMIGSVLRPAKELKAFEKVTLKPGQSQKVTFEITPDMLMLTDINMKQVVESGEFTVSVGGSSVTPLLATFNVK